MDFWGTVRLLVRRWYVVAPALALSVVLTLVTYSSIPTRYSSSGTILLTSPASGAKFSELADPSEVAKVNPLLAFDGSLVISAQIIAQVLNNPETQKEIGAGEGTANTYLANNGETNGPFVFVIVEADSAAESEALVTRALDRARQELDNRQRELNAPPSTFISSQVLVPPTEAAPQIGGKIRFAGAAMVVALLMTLGAAFAVDSFAEAMKRRRVRGGSHRPAQSNPAQPNPAQPNPAQPNPARAGARQAGARQAGPGHPVPAQSGPLPYGPPQHMPRSGQGGAPHPAGAPNPAGPVFRPAPMPGPGGGWNT